MKLARDPWLLFAVPAAVLLAGGWWIVGSIRRGSDGEDSVRFRLADADKTGGLTSRPDRSSEGMAAGPDVNDSPFAIWSGKVLSRAGVPIEGATVTILGYRNVRLGNDVHVEWERIVVVAGADGSIAFEMKPGWVYELAAKAPGFGLEKYVVQSQLSQDLVLDKASDLTGRVIDKATGLPLVGARVVFENGFETYEVWTDADGRYKFEGVGARTANVYVSDNGHVAVGQPVDFLHPGEASELDVLVSQGMQLDGQVLVAGSQTPAANLRVELLDRLTQQVVSSGYTDPSGRFSFVSLSPLRDYVVNAWGPGFSADTLPQSFHSSASVTLTVTPTWALTVGVRSAGIGLGGANVLLMRQDGLPLPGLGTSTFVLAVSNAQGYVSFGSLSRELAYRIVVDRPGYATMEVGSLTAGTAAEQWMNVDLLPGRTLTGKVVDGSGQPVPGVTVRAQRVDGIPAPPLFTMAGADGSFTFDSLAAGFVSLVTFKSGYDNTRVVVEIPAGGETAPVDLVIEPLVTGSPAVGGGLAGGLGGSLGGK
jgi:hypothetical protein